MIYCFDLDGTLCETINGDYKNAKPIKNRIHIVNELFNQNHTIIIESARGSETGIDWKIITEEQLISWELKYTILRTGKKIHADFYIDDKAVDIESFFKRNSNING